MADLAVAFGLVFVLEGALYALFPEGMKQLSLHLLQAPVSTVRMLGLSCAALGFLIIAALRGF
jgi:uncharacterized protein